MSLESNPESFSKVYQRSHRSKPPTRVERGSSSANGLAPARGYMQGFDFSMQLWVDCPGACLYCYVPQGGRLTPWDVRGPGGSI